MFKQYYRTLLMKKLMELDSFSDYIKYIHPIHQTQESIYREILTRREGKK